MTHGAGGHAFSYLRAGSAASRMTPSELPEALIRGAKFLHVSGISQAISASACDTVFAAIGIARAAGVKVASDSNLRLKLWPLARARAVIKETVAMCDLFLPSLEDAELFTGLSGRDAIMDWCLAAGAPIVVLKLGKDGAIVATPEGRTAVPGRVVDAVDATGAGDCFAGALLARLAAGDTTMDAVRYANAAAALQGRPGAQRTDRRAHAAGALGHARRRGRPGVLSRQRCGALRHRRDPAGRRRLPDLLRGTTR